MKLFNITLGLLFFANILVGQIVREYTFSADSVHVFSTSNPVNSFYLPYDISGINKPMYAEPFSNDVSFPTLAQNIYGPAGSFTGTIFGGESPQGYAWGFGAVTVIINEIFTSADFPIILEGDFFNRSSYGSFNESYFWIGNSNYTHFNPSNSVLPTPNVQQGILIGGLPDRTLISNGGSYLTTPVRLYDDTHNLTDYNEWNAMKTILDILDDGSLVIYNVLLNDICVLPEPVVVVKSDNLNLNSFRLAICVDDFAKDFKVTKNAFLFQLPNVVACENEIISLNADFDEELCLDLSYNWSLPGSNIGFANIKSPSNIKYQNHGNYAATLTISDGQFTKTIPFEINIDAGPSQFLTQNLCSNDSIYFNNQWIYNSGLYQQVLTSQDGCDSTITLDVIFQDTVRSISQIELCQGDSLLINGQWIFEDGNFSVLSTTANGCDSIASIIIDLIPQVGIFDTIKLCQGDSIFINNNWYFDAQDVFYFDQNSFCPISVTTTILNRLNYNFLDTVEICAKDSIFFNNSWIKIPGRYQEFLTSTFGCDSLITLDLIYFDTLKTSIDVEICQGDSILIGTNWVSQSGIYQINEVNDNGCDSLVVISLNLVEQTNFYDTINICEGDSVNINNNWISDEQIVSYFDLSSNCPKQIFASVLIKPLFNQFYEVKTCANDSIYFNNQWIYNSGLYQQVLTSQDGCDSTITLDVIFQDTVRSISQIELCQGDSLLINGQWIYEDGNFTVLSTTSNGCDSIASIIIDLIPQVGIFDTINLCQGDSVFINNNWYFDAQDVTYFDLNSFCPISVTSTIESLPSYSFIDNISICPNDSTFYKGRWISEEGSFSFNYKTNLGCDSVFTLNTVQILFPDEPISMVDCDSGIYELTVDTDTNWSFVWSNGSLSNPTIFEDDTTASILYTHNNADCLVSYNIDLPSIPFDGEVPLFVDTIVYPGKPLKYIVDLDGNFWSLDWYQDDKLSCEGCFEHMIQTQSASEIDLIFTHISGCVYYRNLSIGIDASQDIYIPNIFAPESTSGNDKWKVYIPECFMIEMVRIYDRWGNLVYTIENPSVIEWDGTYRGRYLEQGVYSYLITYTDPVFAQKIKSGDVTLIR